MGNLTRRKETGGSFFVPDSVIVGDRGKNEYESSLDSRQQEVLFFFRYSNLISCLFQSGGFETPAETETLTNFVKIGQTRDKNTIPQTRPGTLPKVVC